MTNQQYISIAKLLEQNNPGLFEQLKSELSYQVNVELLFIDFCVVLELRVSEIIERPYNREASRLKSLFIGVLLQTIQKDTIPRGYKKEVAEVLGIDYRKIGDLIQKTNLYLKTYTDFSNQVEEIIKKQKSLYKSSNLNDNSRKRY